MEEKDYLDIITEASESFEKTVTQVLSYTKIISGLILTATLLLFVWIGSVTGWNILLSISLGIAFLALSLMSVAVYKMIVLKYVHCNLKYTELLSLEKLRLYEGDKVYTELLKDIDMTNTRDEIMKETLEEAIKSIRTPESLIYRNILLKLGGYVNYKN